MLKVIPIFNTHPIINRYVLHKNYSLYILYDLYAIFFISILIYMKKYKKLLLLIVILLLFSFIYCIDTYENLKKNKKYIFISGLHRSGISILYKILGSSNITSKHVNTGVSEDEGQHLQSVYPSAKIYGGIGNFCFNDDYHYVEDNKLLTESNKIKIIKEWEKYWDTTRNIYIEKSPPNIIHTLFLQELVQNSYFITIIRHPLAVANASNKWKKQSLERHLDHWLKAHEIFYNDMKKLKKVLVIKYEDLCENPRKVINEIQILIDEKLDISDDELIKLNNTNGKYFEYISPSIIKKYEDKINKYGYSLLKL